MRHSVFDTMNTFCDGCGAFECESTGESALHPWKFKCSELDRELEYKELFRMTEDKCPRHREMKKRKFTL